MPETVTAAATPTEALTKLGLSLPPVGKPLASYINCVRTGNLVFVSGQLPMKDGKPALTGKVGRDCTLEQGKEAARVACLNALAIAANEAGGLDRIKRIVRTVGHVNCAPGFTDVHLVNNGASDLLHQVFGEKGRHARLSLGAFELPLNVPFEFELICEV